MVPADDANSRIADYLARLEAALEVLGPSEAAETTAEIGSYLAQADADDRLDSQLETLGAPESFAAGILAERGLLPAAAPTERASGVRRTLAALIDVLVAVIPLVLLSSLLAVVPLGTAASGVGRWQLPLLFTAALLLGVAVAWGIRYWRNRSRGGGRASVGMVITGLRAVRAGGDTRIVRAISIPGGGHRVWSRAGAAAKFLGAFAVIFLLTVSIVDAVTNTREYSRERDIRAASEDAGAAAAAVSGLGTSIVELVRSDPAGTTEPGVTFGPLLEGRALEQVADLVRSARENDAWAYEISGGSDVAYDRTDNLSLSDGTFVVRAAERGTQYRPMQFTVRKTVTVIQQDANSASSEGSYRITDIQVGEPFDTP